MTDRAHPVRWTSAIAAIACMLLLASCAGGPVRRVSEPSARIQQLTVQPDGNWLVAVRIENFSSIPMRFESLDLALRVDGSDAGTLQLRPALTVGPESADVADATLAPSAAGKYAVADALASRRSVDYILQGTIESTPDEGRLRSFDVERRSALSPAPGLAGVMR